MDLSTRAAGLVFNTPLLPGSGPLTGTDERMIYLAKQGIGGSGSGTALHRRKGKYDL